MKSPDSSGKFSLWPIFGCGPLSRNNAFFSEKQRPLPEPGRNGCSCVSGALFLVSSPCGFGHRSPQASTTVASILWIAMRLGWLDWEVLARISC